MEEKVKQYYIKLGIDLDSYIHPIAKELNIVEKGTSGERIMDHLSKLLIIDIETIKKHNSNDFKYYIEKLNKTDISFWGERFELYLYAKIIMKLKDSDFKVRRGLVGIEPDFIIYNNKTKAGVESTSVFYSDSSKKTDPIQKIISKCKEKEEYTYANLNTCLIIDYTNLNFYRGLLNNFKESISNIIANQNSKYGAILYHFNYHQIVPNNLLFQSKAYDYINPKIDQNLKEVLNLILGERDKTNDSTGQTFVRVI